MSDSDICRLLLDKGQARLEAPREKPVRFTGFEPADILISDLEQLPHAYVLANVMNRQMKAETAFAIPYLFSQKLGGFSFGTLASLDQDAVRRLMTEPRPLHRLHEIMARCFYEAIRLINSLYGGNAARIWEGEPDSAMVIYRFLGFQGVGPKIATLATNSLACDFKLRFSDYRSIDVSVDVHVGRVFERLGLVPTEASPEQITYRARALHPAYPGLLDFPAWEIGRNWCHPRDPDCAACYMRRACPSAHS